MIEILVRLDENSEPVIVGRASCSKAMPNLLSALAESWRRELQLRVIAAASGVDYSGVITTV